VRNPEFRATTQVFIVLSIYTAAAVAVCAVRIENLSRPPKSLSFQVPWGYCTVFLRKRYHT